MAITFGRSLPMVALAGLAGWGVSGSVLAWLGVPGFGAALAAGAAGGLVVLAVALGPPWVRAELRR